MNKLSCLCLLCLLGMVPSASAQYTGGSGDGYASASLSVTRYVATTGSDAGNDCTNPAMPCATVAHAVSQANAGNILDIAAGTYTEPGLVIDKALTIQGAGVVVQ